MTRINNGKAYTKTNMVIQNPSPSLMDRHPSQQWTTESISFNFGWTNNGMLMITEVSQISGTNIFECFIESSLHLNGLTKARVRSNAIARRVPIVQQKVTGKMAFTILHMSKPIFHWSWSSTSRTWVGTYRSNIKLLHITKFKMYTWSESRGRFEAVPMKAMTLLMIPVANINEYVIFVQFIRNGEKKSTCPFVFVLLNVDVLLLLECNTGISISRLFLIWNTMTRLV